MKQIRTLALAAVCVLLAAGCVLLGSCRGDGTPDATSAGTAAASDPTGTAAPDASGTDAGDATATEPGTATGGIESATDAPAPRTVTVTYRPGNGEADTVATVLTGACAVQPNDPARDGYRFVCWAREGGETAYNFSAPVNADLVLTAVWEQGGETVRLRWNADEVVSFLFDGTTPRQARTGEVIRFRLWVSPYYTGEPVVTAGDRTVTCGEDGYYSFTVESAVTVSVSGLRRDTTPIRGLGTEKSPYLITTASQLRTLAESVSAGEEKYVSACIRLDADIDMRGESLTPIGTASNCFQGVFDGNGHTVSDYRLDSSSGVAGFFGYLAEGTVKNLHLSAALSVEASVTSYNYIVGGVVAYCISGDIVNCSFDGSVRVLSSLTDRNVCYLGGIVGFLQGYQTDYTGTVSYCTVRADLSSDGDQTLTAIGGIAGALVGTADSAPAYIHNSVFIGNISGRTAVSGGIAGYLRDRASVAACYTAGSIAARNEKNIAAAGAIVGVADNESAVTGCFSTAKTAAVGADASKYETGDLFGVRYADAENSIDSRKALFLNSYYAPEGTVTVSGRTYDTARLSDLTDLLGWSAEDWRVADGVLLPDAAGADKVSFPVHFEFGRDITLPGKDGQPLTQSRETVTATGYGPLYWVYDGSGMNNFKADDGFISYGYFLDEACTVRLPAALLMTGEMTVYVGFADYSGIAGEYYAVLGDQDVRLTFDDNGKMTMYCDGMLAAYVYVYDGRHILIRNSYFAHLAYPQLENKGYDLDTDCYADRDGQQLIIYDNLFFAKSENMEVRAKRENAAMGVWYTGGGDTYTFLSDGTGTVSDGSAFTYFCTNRTVTLKIGTSQVMASISEDGLSMVSSDRRLELSRTDAFTGTWESAFSARRTLTADGKGTLTVDGQTFPYTVADGVAVFAGGSLSFNEDGLLVLTAEDGSVTVYGREGSFIGTWYETMLNYRMELYGIGKSGYGYGSDSNGVTFTYTADKDENGILTVNMYYRTLLYGIFNLATSDTDGSELLFLAAYTPASGMLVDDYQMCYLDPFCGTWHAPDGMSLTFNGLGTYNIDFHQGETDWVAIGYVTVTVNGTETEVRYTYDKQTGTAAFTYAGQTYTVARSDSGVTVNGQTAREPDGLQESGWRTADGSMTLAFNGRSHVGLGEVVLNRAGSAETLRYTLTDGADGQVATLYGADGTVLFTVTFGGQYAVLRTPAGETAAELGRAHRLLGETYLLGSGYELFIGTDMDADGVCIGRFGTVDVSFLYVDGTYLAMYAEGTLLYYVGWYGEDTAVLLDGSFQVVSVICHSDGLRGTYTAADGSVLELDGRSAAAAYMYPAADLTHEADGEMTREALTYRCEDGVYIISEIDRSGEQDVLVDRWRITTEPCEGAVAFTAEDGRVLYLVPVED